VSPDDDSTAEDAEAAIRRLTEKLREGMHYTKVRGCVESVDEQGGKTLTGGFGDGWVIRPTVLVGLPPDSRHVCEEIFGPVRRAHRVSAALTARTVWVNCFFIRDLRAPFGGVGDSGVGREGGDFSRELFTQPKAVVMQIAPA
jgi:aminomuconate-semialdehyde/2-hydroxymuconate-6-semialdehyde dehydrogenase